LERHRAWSIGHRVRRQPFDKLRAGSQNPEEKKLKLSSSQLLATDYWLLDSLIADFGIRNLGIWEYRIPYYAFGVIA
jgi:hypothetical protein